MERLARSAPPIAMAPRTPTGFIPRLQCEIMRLRGGLEAKLHALKLHERLVDGQGISDGFHAMSTDGVPAKAVGSKSG